MAAPDRAAYIRDRARLLTLRREYDDIVDALDSEFTCSPMYVSEIQRRSEALEDFEHVFYERYPWQGHIPPMIDRLLDAEACDDDTEDWPSLLGSVLQLSS